MVDYSGVNKLVDALTEAIKKEDQLDKKSASPKVKVNNQASKELDDIAKQLKNLEKQKIDISKNLTISKKAIQKMANNAMEAINTALEKSASEGSISDMVAKKAILGAGNLLQLQKLSSKFKWPEGTKEFIKKDNLNQILVSGDGILTYKTERRDNPNFNPKSIHAEDRDRYLFSQVPVFKDEILKGYEEARNQAEALVQAHRAQRKELNEIEAQYEALLNKQKELNNAASSVQDQAPKMWYETDGKSAKEIFDIYKQLSSLGDSVDKNALASTANALQKALGDTSSLKQFLGVLKSSNSFDEFTAGLAQITQATKQDTTVVNENTEAHKKNNKAKSQKKNAKPTTDTASTQAETKVVEDNTKAHEKNNAAKSKKKTSKKSDDIAQENAETQAVENNTKAQEKNAKVKSKKKTTKKSDESAQQDQETQSVEKNTEAHKKNQKARQKKSKATEVKQDTAAYEEQLKTLQSLANYSQLSAAAEEKVHADELRDIKAVTAALQARRVAEEDVQNSSKKKTDQSKEKSESKSTSSTKKESKAVQEAGDAFEKTAKSKRKYAKANEEVDSANKKSTKSLTEEEKALKRLQSAAEKAQLKLKNTDINWNEYNPSTKNDLSDQLTKLSNVDLSKLNADQLRKYTSQVKSFFESLKGEKIADPTKITGLAKVIAQFYSMNSSMSADAKAQLRSYINELQSGTKPTVQRLKEISEGFDNIVVSERMAGRYGSSTLTLFTKHLKSANAQLLTMFFSWQDWIRYTRNAFNAVRELDTALIDLKKTTAMNADELSEFYNGADNVAREMGVTTKAIIDQASAWSRLGYNTKEESETMAKLSSKFASISPGMGVEEAQTGLVSIMKAWDVDVNRVERDIMDNVNTLGNKFAENNADIIAGMERAGATLSAIGMDINDSFALFTGAQEIIQNAEVVGTALKTLSLRIRGYDEETEQLSDDVVKATGKVADLTKTASNGYAGISLWKDASQTEYKSLVQYLGEIADIWDEIDAKSQTQLLDNLFGKRGASVGSAILQNFDQVRNALQAMEESAGSANKEMGIIRESLDFKINNLKETWVGIVQDLIDSGKLGKLIDGLVKISEVLGVIIDHAGILGTIVGAITLQRSLRDLDTTLAFLKQIPIIIKDIAATKDVFGALATNSSTVANHLGSLVGAFAAIPGPVLAVTAIIAGAIIIFKTYQKHIKELRDSAYDASQEFQKSADTLDESVSKYEELSKKLHGANLSEEEAYQVKSELVTLQNDLNTKYADEHAQLDLVNGDYETQIELIKNLSKEKANQYIKENRSGIKNAEKEVSKTDSVQLNTQDMIWDEQFIKDLKGRFGDKISSFDIDGSYEIKVTAEKGEIENVLNDVYDYIEQYQKDHPEMGDFVNFEDIYDNISDALNTYGADEALQKNKEIIDTAAQAKIVLDDTYSELFNTAEEAISKYNAALESGEGVNEAKAKIEDLRDTIKSTVTDPIAMRGFDNLFSGFEDSSQQIYDMSQKIASQFSKNLYDTNGFKLNQAALIEDYLKGLNANQRYFIAGLKIDWSSFDANEAIERMQEELDNAHETLSVKTEFSIQDYSNSFTSKLANVESSYAEFYENVVKGKDKAVDIDSIEKLRGEIVETGTQAGVTAEQFKEFETVVGNSTSSTQEMQDAYNKLSTQLADAYFDDATKGLKDVDEQTLQLIKDQLILKGYTKDSVNEYLDNKVATLRNTQSLLEQLDSKWAESTRIVNESTDQIADEMQKLGEGGNVDLLLRPQIDTQALKDAGFEAGEGVATVFTETFTNEAGDVAMNFTPILPDGTVMEESEFVKYCERVVDGAEDTLNLKIGATFEGDDALKQAEEFATKLHKLQAVFYGEENVEDHFAQFLREDVEALGEEAEALGVTTEYLAAFKAQALLANGAINTSTGIAQLTALCQSMGVTGDAAIKLKNILDRLNNNSIMSDTERKNLEAALNNIVTDAVKAQSNITIKASTPKTGKGSGSAAGKEAADAYVKAYEEEVKKLDTQKERGLISERTYLDKLKALNEKYFKDNAKYAEKWAEVAAAYGQKLISYYGNVISGVTTLLSSRISALNKQKDAAIKAITDERDAVLQALNDEKEAAEAAYKAKLKAIQNEIDKYNDQIKAIQKQQKAVEKVIKAKQKEIKAIEKANKAKEKEKKSEEQFIKEQQKIIKANQKEIDARNEQIEALQEQIDAINKVNEARKESLELAKAEYDFQRQMNQRTKLVYTGEKGQMRYEHDEAGLRDARENLDDKKEQAKVSALQKKVDALQDEVKAYNKIIDQYQKVIDAHQEIIDGIDEYLEKQQALIDEINEFIESQQEIVDRYQEEIDLIQESIDALQERKDIIQKSYDEEMEMYDQRIKAAQKMYDQMQKDAEKYWDALIDKLEETKAKWEQLAEVETVAKAWSLVADEMARYGFTVDDVLNDVPGAFDKFKDAYINALTNMGNGTDYWKQGVQYAAGEAESNYQKVTQAANAGSDAVVELAKSTEGLQQSAGDIDTFAKSLSGAGTETSNLKTASEGLATNFTALTDESEKLETLKGTLSEIVQSIEEKTKGFEDEGQRVGPVLDEEIQKLKDLKTEVDLIGQMIGNMQTNIDLSGITGQFDNLADAIGRVADKLNGTDGTTSIANAMQSLSEINFEGLISQFGELKKAVLDVAATIGGGSSGGDGSSGDSGSSGGAVGSLVSSFQNVKTEADSNIGASSEEEGGTVIGDVNQLGAAIDTVTNTKVGLTEAEADDGTLVGATVGLHEKVDEHIGTEAGDDGKTVIGDFNQLGQAVDDIAEKHVGKQGDGSSDDTLVGSVKAVSEETTEDIAGTATDDFETFRTKVESAKDEVVDLKSKIDDVVSGSPYKITIEIETIGDIPSIGLGKFTGTAVGGQAYATGSAHVEGSANLKGNWGVKNPGKSLVGELGQELVVRNGRFFTVGDNGPEFVQLQSGDVVFNHLQTKQLLDKKNLVLPGNMRGRAFAEGSATSALSALPQSSASRKIQEKLSGVLTQVVPAVSNLSKVIERQTNFFKKNVDKVMSKVSTSAVQPNVTVNNPSFNVNGVTGEEVMRKIEGEFEGLMLTAYQKAMK